MHEVTLTQFINGIILQINTFTPDLIKIKINVRHLLKIKHFLFTFCINALLLFNGCSEKNDIACTAEVRAGLNVYIRDSLTNQPLTNGITVTAKDGSYIDTLQNITGMSGFTGAWERKGTYIITVESSGYETYISNPVTVSADECHVIPQVIIVLLRQR